MIRFGKWKLTATGEPVAKVRVEHTITGHQLVAAVLLAGDCSEHANLDGEVIEQIEQLTAADVERNVRSALQQRGADALDFSAWDHSTPAQQGAALTKAEELFPAAFQGVSR